MTTGSLRRRVALITLSVLVVVLAFVVTAVTLTYRSSLERDLRHRLAAAGTAVQDAGSADAAKGLVSGLALEGIATSIRGPAPPPAKGHGAAAPVKPGATTVSNGSLLVLHEVLSDGTRVDFSASKAGISSAVGRLLVVELVVGLAALTLATLLVLRGAKRALRPLSQVVETASRIADGETDQRLRPTRTDTELGSMASAFDQMVDALQAAATSAQETEATMRRFLADASHELRNPVAAIQATAESLLREQPERPRRDEIEAALARNASRLGRLIDDLLSLARLEGAEAPPEQTVDLAELARAAIGELPREPDRPTIHLAADEAVVRGDPDGLLRILRNLLDNAVAATPWHGSIDVTVRCNGAGVEARVTDHGPGVPHEDRERVFERFVRLGDAPRSGTGLGLAIARRIARNHGGELSCDDVPSGASFTLHLPAEQLIAQVVLIRPPSIT